MCLLLTVQPESVQDFSGSDSFYWSHLNISLIHPHFPQIILSQLRATAHVFPLYHPPRAPTFRYLVSQQSPLFSDYPMSLSVLTRVFLGCTVPCLHCVVPSKPDGLNSQHLYIAFSPEAITSIIACSSKSAHSSF